MFVREYIKKIEERINDKTNLIQIITGPRQVGKTTLVLQFLNKVFIPHHYVSADTVPSSNSLWIKQQWDIARLKFKEQNAQNFLLVIDEIQKIHNWSEFVKKEWDEDRRNKLNIKVILLGSSTLLINKGLSESLVGRFELIQLPHWTFKEMNEAFGISEDEYVFFGGYPGAADLIHQEQRWKDYIRNSIIEPSISKDIFQLVNIQKPALLKNLFELACLYNGEIVSFSKMIGQLRDAGNTTTLAHYKDLLDQAWLLTGIEKFSGSKISSRASKPKWLTYNTALVSAYSEFDYSTIKSNPVLWGRKIEQAIGAYLLNFSKILNFKLYYWRENNQEVDFIIQQGKTLIAIEVKLGKIRFHEGLESFNKKYKTKLTLLISDEGMKWQDFLKLDLINLFSK
jgi:predicted AAA+ superfamily ATPase